MSEKKAILAELDFCGCAEKEVLAKALAALMEDFIKESAWADSDEESPEKSWKLRSVDFEENPLLFYLLTDKLDKLDFIQHGSGIRFSWVTDKGKDWLERYKK